MPAGRNGTAGKAIKTVDRLTKLGRYQIREVLGAGGFGTVYRAYDPNLDSEVAIKVLKPELAVNPDHRRRFLREAHNLRRVQHPRVVVVCEVGEETGIPYFVMQMIRGESLQARLDREKTLSLNAVLGYSDQIAEALEALHEAGLIHRDLKPDNVIITQKSGNAILLDLGIAFDFAAHSHASM